MICVIVLIPVKRFPTASKFKDSSFIKPNAHNNSSNPIQVTTPKRNTERIPVKSNVCIKTPPKIKLITMYANNAPNIADGASYSVVTNGFNIGTGTINTPLTNSLYGWSTPSFNVELSDNYYLNGSWYTLDGGLNNYTFPTNGSINPTAWGNAENGTITLIFYANDTVGNIGSSSVVIRKDIEAPNITNITPVNGSVFGFTAPNYTLTIIEGNLNTTQFSIYNGTWSDNYTLSGLSGVLNQSLWNTIGNGSLIIRFYANDSLGNNISRDASIFKDIYAPNITVQIPSNLSSVITPTYSLSINESNLDSIWFSIYNGTQWSQNYTLSSISGTLNQSIWDSIPLGFVLIRFYANDTAGNLGYVDVNITKMVQSEAPPDDTTQPPTPAIPGYNIILLVGMIALVSIKMHKNRKKTIT